MHNLGSSIVLCWLSRNQYWLISLNLSNSSLDKVLLAGGSHARQFEEQRLHSGRTRGHQSLTGSVNDHQRSSKASTIGLKNQEGPFVKAFSDLSLRFSRAFSKSSDLDTGHNYDLRWHQTDSQRPN